jgi:hypothetical protein
MADVQTAGLYEQDFYLWALDQATALRRLRDASAGQGDLTAALNAIDWDNAIEELESLGKRDRRELQSRINVVIEHLTKLETSFATSPRAGWQNTVRRERSDIELLLRQSPFLRPEVPDFVISPSALKTRRQTVEAISRQEADHQASTHAGERESLTEAQVLDDWWPEQPEANL